MEGYRCELFAKALATAVGEGCPTPIMGLGGHQEHLLQILILMHFPKNCLYFYFVLFENGTLGILL